MIDENNLKTNIPKNCEVIFDGKNNKITFEKGSMVHPNKTLRIVVTGDKNTFHVDPNCKLSGTIELHGSNIRAFFGSSCLLSNLDVYIRSNCVFKFGKDTTSPRNGKLYINMHSSTSLIVGEDNMFSYNIKILIGDGHPIYDLETNRKINEGRDYKKFVTLENHVWIGMDTLILGGAYIGEGSVIGASSLANKKCSNNCIVAGNPMKVIRKNISWARNEVTKTIDDCGVFVKKTV